MSGIFEAVLLLLGLGVAVFAAGELWREGRRRRSDREHLDRVVGEVTAPMGEDTRSGAELRLPGTLESRLRCAGLDLPAWSFVAAVALFAGAVAYGVWAAVPQLPIAALFAGTLAAVIPFSLVASAAHARARKFLEKFVDSIDIMCAALDGGEPPQNALAAAAVSSEDPSKRELLEAHQRLQLGFSVRRSFSRIVERYDSEGVRLITQVLIVKWQAGGDLSPVLRSVNQVARERLRQDRELRTQLAGAQASAILTAILPYLLLPFFFWKRPEWFYDLTTHPIGVQLLTVAILFQFVGFLWLRRLMRVAQ